MFGVRATPGFWRGMRPEFCWCFERIMPTKRRRWRLLNDSSSTGFLSWEPSLNHWDPVAWGDMYGSGSYRKYYPQMVS